MRTLIYAGTAELCYLHCITHFMEAVIIEGAQTSIYSVSLASYENEGKGDEKSIEQEDGNMGKDGGRKCSR